MPDGNGNGAPDYRDPATQNGNIPGGQGADNPGGPLRTATHCAGGGGPVFLTLLALGVLARARRVRLGALPVMTVAILVLPAAPAGAAEAPQVVMPHSDNALVWRKGWYIGADFGVSKLKPEDQGSSFVVADDRSQGFRLLAGYDWSSRLSLEGFYLSAGSADIDHANPVIGSLGELKYELLGAGLNYPAALARKARGALSQDRRRPYP
ncbi:MAG: hypothetical protein AABZ84_09240 [Pseudomonadota bacterium]